MLSIPMSKYYIFCAIYSAISTYSSRCLPVLFTYKYIPSLLALYCIVDPIAWWVDKHACDTRFILATETQSCMCTLSLSVPSIDMNSLPLSLLYYRVTNGHGLIDLLGHGKEKSCLSGLPSPKLLQLLFSFLFLIRSKVTKYMPMVRR